MNTVSIHIDKIAEIKVLKLGKSLLLRRNIVKLEVRNSGETQYQELQEGDTFSLSYDFRTKGNL